MSSINIKNYFDFFPEKIQGEGYSCEDVGIMSLKLISYCTIVVPAIIGLICLVQECSGFWDKRAITSSSQTTVQSATATPSSQITAQSTYFPLGTLNITYIQDIKKLQHTILNTCIQKKDGQEQHDILQFGKQLNVSGNPSQTKNHSEAMFNIAANRKWGGSRGDVVVSWEGSSFSIERWDTKLPPEAKASQASHKGGIPNEHLDHLFFDKNIIPKILILTVGRGDQEKEGDANGDMSGDGRFSIHPKTVEYAISQGVEHVFVTKGGQAMELWNCLVASGYDGIYGLFHFTC